MINPMIVSAVSGGEVMSPNADLALLIDEHLPPDGEIQIKRRKPFGGLPTQELILWVPSTGSTFPRAQLRLRANTTLDLLDQLEKALAERTAKAQAQEQEEHA